MATKVTTKTKYDELLSQVQLEAQVVKDYKAKVDEFEKRAKDIVPRLFFALKDEGLDAVDAKDRIEKDLVGVWKKGTIRDALPPEAKDPIKARAGKMGRQKQLETKRQREEQERIEEEQRNQEVTPFKITAADFAMSGMRLGEMGPETYDQLYHPENINKQQEDEPEPFDTSRVYDADTAEIPRDDEFGRGQTLDKNLLADITVLKKENSELRKENETLRKKNSDLEAVNKKLDHSTDILIADLKKMTEERDHYKSLYEKGQSK